MRPRALKQACLAVTQIIIIAVCLSAPASAEKNPPTLQPPTTPTTPTTTMTPGKPSFSDALTGMVSRASDLLSIVRSEIEGPLLPWLEKISLTLAGLIMIAAFARLWKENAGAGVDLFWWFARLGVVFALLGSGPKIVDGMFAVGQGMVNGNILGEGGQGALLTFYTTQRRNFDRAYEKFTEGTFIVQGENVQSAQDRRLGVTQSSESILVDPVRKLDSISRDMPLLFDSLNFSRAVLSFGDFFLTMLGGFLMIAMRLAAPVMIALAIDRSMAQRVTYPYLWGVVVLTLIWPIIALIIKAIAYMGGNIAMALGDKQQFLFDEKTMQIIQDGSQQPVYTVLFAAVIMLIAGLSLWGSPYIAYQLSVGGVYETVSQTISGWAGYLRDTGMGQGIARYSTAIGAAIARQSGAAVADTASAGAIASAMTWADPARDSLQARASRIAGGAGAQGGPTRNKFNARNSLAIPGQNVFPETPKTGSGQPVGGVIETTGAGAKRDIEQGRIPRY